jgi:hypothetical protein
MTAVMRAVTVVDNRPKVLRIAIVQNGRIAEEKILAGGEITIGSAEDATFVLRNAPRSFRLFERRGNAWHLNLREGMGGRIALATGITDIAALGSQRSIALAEDSRGKVVLGDTTVLFQLVPPPPISPKPRLPLAVTGGLANRIDWSLTIVAALSFLFHFGIVGAMYSDWMDPIVDTPSAASLVDLGRVLHEDAPLEQPKADADTPATATDPAKKDPVAAKEPGKTPSTTKSPGPSTSKPGDISDARAAQLAKQADAMNMGMIVSINGGPATKGALDRSDIPAVDMSSAAASAAAVAKGNGDLKTNSGGDTQDHKGSLSSLAKGTKKEGNDHAGPENNTPAPTLIVNTSPPTASGSVSDADAVVSKLRGRFRKCYENGLDGDPNMRGKVVLEASVGSNGEVSSVAVVSNSGLSGGVAACLQSTLSRATFTANGPSKVRVPVSFDHQ